MKNNFDNWVESKLQQHQRAELLESLVLHMTTEQITYLLRGVLTSDQKAQIVDDFATDLNDEGWDWDK